MRRKVSPENPEAEVPPSNSHDANMKLPRQLKFSKAKTAIKRYSSSIHDGSMFGRSLSDFTSNSEQFGNFDVIEDHINEVTDKAFVVMQTYTASTIAMQSMQSSKPVSMEVSIAEPRDILWENVYYSKGARRTRTLNAEFFCLFFISFSIVPVALISLLELQQAQETLADFPEMLKERIATMAQYLEDVEGSLRVVLEE